MSAQATLTSFKCSSVLSRPVRVTRWSLASAGAGRCRFRRIAAVDSRKCCWLLDPPLSRRSDRFKAMPTHASAAVPHSGAGRPSNGRKKRRGADPVGTRQAAPPKRQRKSVSKEATGCHVTSRDSLLDLWIGTVAAAKGVSARTRRSRAARKPLLPATPQRNSKIRALSLAGAYDSVSPCLRVAVLQVLLAIPRSLKPSDRAVRLRLQVPLKKLQVQLRNLRGFVTASAGCTRSEAMRKQLERRSRRCEPPSRRSCELQAWRRESSSLFESSRRISWRRS